MLAIACVFFHDLFSIADLKKTWLRSKRSLSIAIANKIVYAFQTSSH